MSKRFGPPRISRSFPNSAVPAYIKWADDLGVMGTRNYRQRRFEMVDQVDGRQLIGGQGAFQRLLPLPGPVQGRS
jgi:hypothetical protein